MASETTHLGLLKKDPEEDKKDTFNIQAMLNENWDKIDQAIAKLENMMVITPYVVDGILD